LGRGEGERRQKGTRRAKEGERGGFESRKNYARREERSGPKKGKIKGKIMVGGGEEKG